VPPHDGTPASAPQTHRTHTRGDTQGLRDRCRPAAHQRCRADGDLDGAAAHGEIALDIESIADSIELPDGKVIYPRKLRGEPIDRVACALLDMQQPSRSRFLRLVGPPGTGTSQSGRAIAYRLWTQRGRAVETRRGEPFYGFAEMSGGPSSDEFHAPLPEPAAKSLTIPAAARSGRRASRGSRA
jgi:hypothetical protein